ncbi:hypothetical protein [Yersinia ruckeri]|uniref:hypothetical protein n=1 Tax=Yersinia ruckeri TaxID=29486 RepID=UPI0022384C8C|nr:hypothetical protein [Yersinia ruckeri]MCW6598704.1 hypothetical protein [Yersinia ruckeri]
MVAMKADKADRIFGAMWKGMSEQEREAVAKVLNGEEPEFKFVDYPSIMIGTISQQEKEKLDGIYNDLREMSKKYDITMVVNGKIFKTDGSESDVKH